MQDSASSPPLRPLWIRLWRATARSASISATCRSACHLLAVLLDRGLVRYAEVVDIVDGMISSMEISGPVDCIDSAIALNCSLLRDKSRENPSQTAETSEKIMSWLFRCWKPGKVYASDTRCL